MVEGEAPEKTAAEAAAPGSAPPEPDYRDLYLRAVAELDNYRKRSEKERGAFVLAASESVVRRLLEPLDSVDRALADLARLKASASGELQASFGRSLDGLRAVHRQLMDVLAGEGLQQVPASGTEFDPALHEALATLPHATAPAGAVVEVLRPGYSLRGKLLRPAAVVVSAGPAPAAADETASHSHEGAPQGRASESQ